VTTKKATISPTMSLFTCEAKEPYNRAASIGTDLKTRAVNEFLVKVHSAMSDLEFDLHNINEDTMHDWNRVLNKLTDEILVGEAKTNHSRTREDPPPGQRTEGSSQN
jgi:hypothetical protein